MNIVVDPTSYAVLLWAIAGGSSLTALFAARRDVPGARWLALLSFGVAVWSAGYALELTSASPSASYVWLRVQYLGIATIPYCWLFFSLRYTGRRVSAKLLGALAVVPLLMIMLVWTNDYHRLVWYDYALGENGFAIDAYGLGFAAFTAASYLMFLAGLVLLLRTLWYRPRAYQGQRTILTGLTLAPLTANILYLSDVVGGIDLSPVGFAIAIGGVAFGMMRYNVLDLVPVARDVVVETMSAGVLVLDKRQRVLDANPGAARLLGDGVQDLLGEPLENVFAAGAALIAHGADDRRYDLIEHQGRWLELTLTPLGDAARPYGRLLVLHDVTERVDTETELRRAKEEAEAANDAKVRFLATMSHELRTPLTGILGFSELLREELIGDLNVQQHEYVGNVLESGEHLLALINDLLTYAQLEFGRVPLEPQDVDVGQLLADVAEATRPRLASNTLRLDVAPDVGTVYSDPVQLKELLRHLLSNADKFTHHGTITVAARRDAAGLELSVRDTGIGIAPDYLPELFKVFSQADTSYTRHYGGSGVGLALVGHLCRLLGGTIAVDSTLGEGSSFTVRLPVDVREASSARPATA